MATQKKPPAKGRQTAAQKKATFRQQMTAVVIFAVGLFLTILAFIRGERLWLGLHNALFGLFGIVAYAVGPLTVYISLRSALKKQSIVKPAIIGLLSIAFFCGVIQLLFAPDLLGVSNMDKIANLWTVGVSGRGGGMFYLLLGWPLMALLGKTGAIITMGLALFVVLMFISGKTLIDLHRGVSKPVKQAQEAFETHMQQRAERLENEPPKKKKGKTKIDIALEGATPEEGGFPDDILDEGKAPEIDPVSVIDTLVGEQSPEDNLNPAEIFQLQNPAVPPIGAADVAVEPEEIPLPVEAPPKAEIEETTPIAPSAADFEGENGYEDAYRYPPTTLLSTPPGERNLDISREQNQTRDRLIETLKSFGVEAKVINVSRGPSVTRYELQPGPGVKISKITNLADDIALNLAASGVRIEAPIPNKAAVGIEVPNRNSSIVGIRQLLESQAFKSSASPLSIALGRDIAGQVQVGDIAKFPHVLIAGATGSGKSVCINSIILSLLYKSSPDDVQLLMIDPKVVELGVYNGIPHLMHPVVTDPRKAAGLLNWAVTKMLERYQLFAANNVRDLAGYNKLAESDPERDKLPQIVIIIDELADLMMAAPGEVEDAICRLAQMARAAGMHLIIATQRPSVDVITGVIKANIPSRVAFAVSSQVDSRTILDGGGAEKLLGRGDMLFFPVGSSKPTRIQGCFVSDGEIEKVVEYIKPKSAITYDEEVQQGIEKAAEQVGVKGKGKNGGGGSAEEDTGDRDPMFEEAAEVAIELGQVSTSMLQRKLKLGYARAARVVDQLEAEGVIGPFQGSKPRDVLMSRQQWLERQHSGAGHLQEQAVEIQSQP